MRVGETVRTRDIGYRNGCGLKKKRVQIERGEKKGIAMRERLRYRA